MKKKNIFKINICIPFVKSQKYKKKIFLRKVFFVNILLSRSWDFEFLDFQLWPQPARSAKSTKQDRSFRSKQAIFKKNIFTFTEKFNVDAF